LRSAFERLSLVVELDAVELGELAQAQVRRCLRLRLAESYFLLELDFASA
jgi:hypothetical protein